MEHLLTTETLKFGYLAIFLGMALGSACIPIPSEVVLLFGGAVSTASFVNTVSGHHSPLNLMLVCVWGLAGNMAGSLLAFGVGRLGGRPLVDRLSSKFKRVENDYAKAEKFFEEHGSAAVFFGRVIPIVRTFVSLPAGISEMGWVRFAVLSFLGSIPWTLALSIAGYGLGSSWNVISKYMTYISVLVVVAIVALVAVKWSGRRSKVDAEPVP